MARARPQSGLVIMAMLVAAIYFSGSWPWIKQRLQGLQTNCYTLVAHVDPSLANSICGAVNATTGAIGNATEDISFYAETVFTRIHEWVGAESGLSVVARYSNQMQRSVERLSSARERLDTMMRYGPQATMQGPSAALFQQAIDSHAIAQHLIGQSGGSAQGIAWLRSSAAAPQGFGVLSQLSLAEIYLKGSYGVVKDPQAAQTYLAQAQRSLALLSGSQSPQAQQMLKALPASPAEVDLQIQRAIRQIQIQAQ